MASDKGVELKGGMYAFMSLRIDTTDLARIDSLLGDKVQQAPGFFKDTPVVLDLTALDAPTDDASRVAAADLDTAALLACIRRHHLHPIVASVGDKSSPLASSVALPLIEGGSRRQSGAHGAAGGSGEPAADAASRSRPSLAMGQGRGPDRSRRGDEFAGGAGPQHAVAAEVEYVVRSPMMIDRPVRSGQQVYARDTDLIVVGQVGPGAEVIADNNIHVYGALRGRALCGVSGNTATRIFCQSLEAELVSVAGNYRMLETIPPELRGKPATIAWDNDRLSIDPL